MDASTHMVERTNRPSDRKQASKAEVAAALALRIYLEEQKLLKTPKHTNTDWRNKTTKGKQLIERIKNNKASKKLRQYQKKYLMVAEIFVTDNKGLNVAMTDVTSDFYQGDEGKFTIPFSNPDEIYGTEEEFDESTNTRIRQVAYAVKENGQPIGVVVMGLIVS